MNANVNDPLLFSVSVPSALPSEEGLNTIVNEPVATLMNNHNADFGRDCCSGQYAFLKGTLIAVGCCLLGSVAATLCIVAGSVDYCHDSQGRDISCSTYSFPGGDAGLLGLLGLFGLFLFCSALTVWQCCRNQSQVNTNDDLSDLPMLEPVV